MTQPITPQRRALWANAVMRRCLLESPDDVDIALSAAEIIISTQPIPDDEGLGDDIEPIGTSDGKPVDTTQPLSAFLAYDIHNRKAQGILNRSLQAAKGLSAAARKDLAAALKRGPTDSGEAILRFVDKYRLQLAKLLTTTQLASLLEGAREVAKGVPTLATFPGAVPPPPSLEPMEAVDLIDRLSQLTVEARADAIYRLPADQQTYAQQALAARDASEPTVPPTFTPPAPPAGSPEGIHFPTIDEAVKQLAGKNVMTRERFDALDTAARSKAFTVAGVDAQETLTKIRDALAENVKEGADYATFREKVLRDVNEGTFMSDGHMENVFRTNIQAAFSDGQMNVLNNPIVRSGFPYATYDSIHDDRRRHTHGQLEKLGIGGTNIYRINDPVFQTFRPPWEWMDRCGWSPITVRHAAELGIKEAQDWLRTGVEPSPPAFVKMPDFQPPAGFRRAVSSAPLSVQLSMQPMASFSSEQDDGKPDEETDASLLLAGGGPPSMGALDTAKEQASTKIEKRVKGKGKVGKGKRSRSLFRRLRVKKSWAPSVSLAVGGEQWITIGGHEEGEEKHVGGFHVKVNKAGVITTGRMRGKKVSEVKSSFDNMKRGPTRAIKPRRGPAGPGRQGTGGPPQASGRMAGTPSGSGVPRVGTGGQGRGQPTGTPAAGGVPAAGVAAPAATPTELTPEQKTASIEKVNRRLDHYAAHFRTKGLAKVADWMDLLKDHINEVGVEDALAELEASGSKKPADPNKPAWLEAQYEGAYDSPGETEDDAKFIRGYLARAGITLLPSTNTAAAVDPNKPIISSSSVKNKGINRGGEADFTPSDPNFANKLVESQHLPGLESSEDINTVAGGKVTNLTPEVIAKLDERYGKDAWIIKSYGAEAYAGFGIFFPQKVRAIQQEAKKTIWSANRKLSKKGYYVARDSEGKVVGITGPPSGVGWLVGKQSKMYKFGSEEFMNIADESVKKWGQQAAVASVQEKGANLPTSAEQELKNYYGMTLNRDPSGKVLGIKTPGGKAYNIGTPEYGKIASSEGMSYWVNRAIEHSAEGTVEEEPKFMAQPAFPAVGVTEEERAAGATWETATEGRVHVVVRNGKATKIPYATMAGRGDDLPAVFATEDSMAMEKAAEDAIMAIPESERAGKLYAPDVLKTAEGWKVVELNPSTEGGGSAWLGEDPFTIDAFVSHMTGREPQHVRFIKKLLMDRKHGQAMSVFNPEDHPRRLSGEGGGQFVRKGTPGGTRKVKIGNLTAKFSSHTFKRITGPSLKLHNYKQQDDHSCGFVVALTVSRFFKPSAKARDVLSIVRPKKSSGIDGPSLTKALRKLGIEATYQSDLTIAKLCRLVEQGTPVAVTVYPKDWSSDHWTVVQGFDEADDATGKPSRIYLTNYKSLTIKQFMDEWFERGDGLVCRPRGKRGKALSASPTVPVEPKQPVSLSTEATRDNLSEKVWVVNARDKLRAMIVGRLENDVIPRWYPTFDGKDHNEVDDPDAVGQTKRDYNPEMYERAVEQTEHLCEVLEKEGVQVFRPPLVPPSDAQAEPVGLAAEWMREVFTVFGSKLVVNQPRAAHRNKDHAVLEPFFAALEQAGKAKVYRLPACDFERKDNDLRNDARPFLEGGDVFRLGKDVLVTMSYMATSSTGFRWLADLLAPDGIEVWPAYLTEDWEHGDYILRPAREGLAIAYLGGFVDGLLPSPMLNWDVIELTKDEADNKYAANGISINSNLMLLPKGNPRVVRALEKKGVDVIEVPFDGPMYWQGGIDCATQDLWRED